MVTMPWQPTMSIAQIVLKKKRVKTVITVKLPPSAPVEPANNYLLMARWKRWGNAGYNLEWGKLKGKGT